MAVRPIEQLKQVMEACELGALTLPDRIDALIDAGKAVLQEVSTLTPLNEWVSVEEGLPEQKHNVLAYSPRNGVAEADYADGVWMQYRWSAVMHGVTHWMPLPEIPKEDK